MESRNEITRSFRTRWDHHYAALQQYTARAGTSRVASSHREDFDGSSVPIGAWASTQRQRHRLGFLPADRAVLLEQLPGWEWGPFRPGPPERRERNDEIRRLRAEGVTLAAIGERFGITRQRVLQIAPNRGVNAGEDPGI